MRAMDGGPHRALWVRLVLVLAAMLGLFSLAWSSGDPRVAVPIVLPTILVGALVLTPSLTGLFGNLAGRALGSDAGARPRPQLGRVEALVAREKYDDAIAGYLGLAVDFPTEIELWSRAFEIAAVHLRDLQRLRNLHAFACAELEDPEPRARLDRAYLIQFERHPEGAPQLDAERTRLERERQALVRTRLDRLMRSAYTRP